MDGLLFLIYTIPRVKNRENLAERFNAAVFVGTFVCYPFAIAFLSLLLYFFSNENREILKPMFILMAILLYLFVRWVFKKRRIEFEAEYKLVEHKISRFRYIWGLLSIYAEYGLFIYFWVKIYIP